MAGSAHGAAGTAPATTALAALVLIALALPGCVGAPTLSTPDPISASHAPSAQTATPTTTSPLACAPPHMRCDASCYLSNAVVALWKLDDSPPADAANSAIPIFESSSLLHGTLVVSGQGIQDAAVRFGEPPVPSGTVSGGQLPQSSLASAVYFDGTAHVHVPHHPAFQLAAGTVRFFFQLEATDGTQGLFAKDHAFVEEDGHLHVVVVGRQLQARLQQSSALGGQQRLLRSGSDAVVAGQWHEAAVSFGPLGFQLFLDGTRVAADSTWTQTLSGNIESIALGATNHRDSNGAVRNRMKGWLDNVLVLSGQLEPFEIDAGILCRDYCSMPPTTPPQIESPCSCSGATNFRSHGGSCGDWLKDGRSWCYVESGQCSTARQSNLIPGAYWTYCAMDGCSCNGLVDAQGDGGFCRSWSNSTRDPPACHVDEACPTATASASSPNLHWSFCDEPVNCTLGPPVMTAACNVTCGGGTQTVLSQAVCQPLRNGLPCPNVAERDEPCNEQACPCIPGPWTGFSPCSTTCGGGVKTRTRVLSAPTGANLASCTEQTIETQPCNLVACVDTTPVNCQVGEWSAFGPCSTTCGSGVQTRSRAVLQEPLFGGKPCPELNETAICSKAACPVDCTMTAFSNFSACSGSCGVGVQTKTRAVVRLPSGGGAECGETIVARECALDPCLVCQPEWSAFGPCSATCGEGNETRRRTVLSINESTGAQTCALETQSRPCTLIENCPVPCVLGPWSPFSPCSASCGGGLQSRTRAVLEPAQHGGEPCGATSETQACAQEVCIESCPADFELVLNACVPCGPGTTSEGGRGAVCRDIDACSSHPCSVFSAGCTDSAAPAGEGPEGRECGPCIAGYLGDGASCRHEDLVAIEQLPCFCPDEDPWYKTACGASDAQPCPAAEAGQMTRRCLSHLVWDTPVLSCGQDTPAPTTPGSTSSTVASTTAAPLEVDACASNPCSKNSRGCTDLPGPTSSALGRRCLGCRAGYAGDGETCVSIEVRDTVAEAIAPETAERDAAVLEGLSARRADSAEVELLFAGLDKVIAANQSLGVVSSSFGLLSNIVRVNEDAVGQTNAVPEAASTLTVAATTQLDDDSVLHMASSALTISAYLLGDAVTIEWPDGNPGLEQLEIRKDNASFLDAGGRASVPPSVLAASASAAGGIRVQVASYRSSEQIFPDTLDAQARIASAVVVSIEVAGIRHKAPLPDPVVLEFPVGASPDAQDLACVFYDVFRLTWDTFGCTKARQADGTVLCSCNHTTNFAVLATPTRSRQDDPEPGTYREALVGWFSEIGVAVSAACLAMVIAPYTLFPKLRNTGKAIIVRLAFWLLAVQATFMFGIEAEELLVCRGVTVLLHFALLMAFAWMFWLGVHLRHTLVDVFHGGASWRTMTAASWLGSAAIAGVTAALRFEQYGEDGLCWLPTSGGTIWAFLGPMCLSIAANLYVLGRVVASLRKVNADFRQRRMRLGGKGGGYTVDPLPLPPPKGAGAGSPSATPPRPPGAAHQRPGRPDARKQVVSLTRAVASFVVVLGVTWLFGVLAIGQASRPLRYAFTLCNSFQGVFIFYFHCFSDDKVRVAFRQWAFQGKARRQVTGVDRRASETSAPSRTPKRFSLSKFFRSRGIGAAAGPGRSGGGGGGGGRRGRNSSKASGGTFDDHLTISECPDSTADAAARAEPASLGSLGEEAAAAARWHKPILKRARAAAAAHPESEALKGVAAWGSLVSLTSKRGSLSSFVVGAPKPADARRAWGSGPDADALADGTGTWSSFGGHSMVASPELGGMLTHQAARGSNHASPPQSSPQQPKRSNTRRFRRWSADAALPGAAAATGGGNGSVNDLILELEGL